jgi:ribokinase
MSAAVCVVGSFMMDLVASAARRPQPGETVVGSEFGMYLGGKGFNQAIAAARAGARTSLIGRLGDDEFGRSFGKAIRDAGIDDTGVVADPELGTGVGLPVLEPDGQNSIIIVPRANSAVDAAQIRDHADLIAEADVLLVQLELPLPAILEASTIAKRAGTKVVLNPAPFAPVGELSALVDVLVPNEVELYAFAELNGQASVEVAARRVHAAWGADVVATLGARGALIVGADPQPVPVPSRPVVAVDTIGAGDTFCAYLAAGLGDGASLVEAAGWANGAAALAVTRRGGADSAPFRDEVDAMTTTSSPQSASGMAASHITKEPRYGKESNPA